jgi:hypothetical protein
MWQKVTDGVSVFSASPRLRLLCLKRQIDVECLRDALEFAT